MDLKSGFALGDVRVYPLEGRVVGPDGDFRIQPKAMDVLLFLAERAPQVVEREDLLSAVWGERAPSDEPLTRCIGNLRRALTSEKQRSHFIRTIPKRGYQLLIPPEPLGLDGASEDTTVSSEPVAIQATPGKSTSHRLGISIAAFLILIAIAIGLGMNWRPGDTSRQADGQEVYPQSADLDEGRSIAVLAFADLSAEQDQEYMGDGLAEELLNRLTRIPDLRVISRTSSFSFKGKDVRLTQVAEELGVAHILEGSVRKSGDTLRITAQLIDARTDTHLWSASYDRNIQDIFAVQGEIAASVVNLLKVSLFDTGQHSREPDPDAYLLFLQAIHIGRIISAENLRRSNELLEQALTIDPEFAPAWVNLASNYNNLSTNSILPFVEGFGLAREAAEKALSVDPNSAGAYAILGWAAMWNDQDISASALYYGRALALEPTDLNIIGNSALLLKSLGRLDEAIELLEYHAIRDPLNPTAQYNLGLAYLSGSRWDDSIEYQESTLSLTADYSGARTFIGTALLMKGNAQEALAVIEEEPSEQYRLLGLVMAQHALGNSAESDSALFEMIEKYETGWAYNIAYVLAFRNDIDLAFDWLDKAVEYGDPGLADILAEVLFLNLHPDPRWNVFLDRIGKAPPQVNAIDFEITLPN